jgi:CRISPR-associated protein Cas2
MKSVLIYDIESDRVRAKVADACLDYALVRIQYSAFFGEISANHLEELLQRIRRLVGRSAARVEIFPICDRDLRMRRTFLTARFAPAGDEPEPLARNRRSVPLMPLSTAGPGRARKARAGKKEVDR